jgi:hypothetical protein
MTADGRWFRHHAGVSGPLPDNPAVVDVSASEPVTFTVVGIGVFPHDVVPADMLDSMPRLYLSAAGATTYGDPQNVNYAGMLIQLQPGTDIARFREQVEVIQARYPEVHGDLNFSLQEGRRENTQRAIRPQALALGAFGLLAGFTTFFVIGQLLVREISVEANEHSVLAALGMSPRQLFVLAIAPVLIVSAAGALLAVPVTVAGSSLFPVGPARLAEPDPGIDANVAVLAAGAFLMVLVLLARTAPAAARHAKASRAAPGAARRRAGSRSRTAGDLPAAIGLRPPAVVGTAMALPLRGGPGTAGERAAVAATAAALAGVAAALVFGSNLDRLVSTPRLYGQTWDDSVDFGWTAMPAPEVLNAVADNRAVRAVSGGNYGVALVGGRQVPAVGLDSLRGSVFPTILEGRVPVAPDEIALGGTVLSEGRLSLGDQVEVGFEGSTRRMRIVGRAVFPLLGQAGLEPTGLGYGAVVTADVLGPAGPGVDVENYNFFLIDYRDGPQSRQALAAARQALRNPCGGVCVFHHAQRPGDVVAYERVQYTPLALAGLLVILTVATLDQSLVTSIGRRRRDLALLKSLGFVRRQILATVSWHASVQVLLASLVGLPIGIIAGRWAWVALARQLGASHADYLPALALVLVFAVPVVIANLVVLGPGLVAARARPAVVLRAD